MYDYQYLSIYLNFFAQSFNYSKFSFHEVTGSPVATTTEDTEGSGTDPTTLTTYAPGKSRNKSSMA